MKKLILFSLLLAVTPLWAQSPFTFSPIFIGIGAPVAPTVPVPCPPGAIYFRNDSVGGIYFCNGTVGAIPQNGGGDHDGDNSGGPSDGDGNL